MLAIFGSGYIVEVDIRMDILGESQQYDKGNVKCKRKFLIQKCGFLP